MNERFFQLPATRQAAIVNAALQVFSQNEYKKAPMAEIAAAGGISKSLLFHYFRNKRELYLYLWDFAARTTSEAVAASGALATSDLFELLLCTTHAKCEVMRKHPYLYAFSTRAYYEREPEIREAIQRDIAAYTDRGEQLVLAAIDRSALRPDVPLEDIYHQFVMLSNGYMLKQYQAETIDPDAIERDFEHIIDHWRTVYTREA